MNKNSILIFFLLLLLLGLGTDVFAGGHSKKLKRPFEVVPTGSIIFGKIPIKLSLKIDPDMGGSETIVPITVTKVITIKPQMDEVWSELENGPVCKIFANFAAVYRDSEWHDKYGAEIYGSFRNINCFRDDNFENFLFGYKVDGKIVGINQDAVLKGHFVKRKDSERYHHFVLDSEDVMMFVSRVYK